MIKHKYIHKHRRAVLFVLLTCAFAINAKAQLWNKTYIEDRPVLPFSSVVADSGFYYITGTTLDKDGTTNWQRLFIGKLDSDGDIIKYISIHDSTNKYFAAFDNTLIKDLYGGYTVTGYSSDSISRIPLIRVDANLNLISLTEIDTPNTGQYIARGIIQYTDGSYFIGGMRTPRSPINNNILIARLDQSGHRIWEQYYNFYATDFARSIIVLKNGHIMVGAVRMDNNQTHEHANTWLLEVDTGGNVVRQWFDPNDSTYAAEGLLQTQDGGFIYGAQKKNEQTVNSVWYVGTIVKLDSNFNKQWTYTDGYQGELTGFSDVEVLPDGSIIACGKYSYRDALIVKLSPTGQLIWRRTYVGLDAIGSENYLTDIDILPDGGLIAVGQCQNLQQIPPQVGWFLKLDSNGCEIENCTVGINEIPNKLQLTVYPNPFINQITIALNEVGHQQVSVSVTNLIGQTLYSNTDTNISSTYTKNLDLRYLPNGIYFIMVNVDGEKIVKQVVKE